MGLDQYLYLESYQSEMEWDEKRKCSYPRELKSFGDEILKRNFKSKTTKYQVGYWRKFNALQGWMEKRFGEEETARGVSLWTNDIEELLDICKNVLKALETAPIKKDNYGNDYYECPLAIKLLPPTDGFFFGSQLIDEWYKHDLEYTVELFSKVLEFIKKKNYDVIYDASW